MPRGPKATLSSGVPGPLASPSGAVLAWKDAESGEPAVSWYMTELCRRRPDLWREDVDRIFALLEQPGVVRTHLRGILGVIFGAHGVPKMLGWFGGAS